MQPSVILNNGVVMPMLGIGAYQVPAGAETERVVLSAFELGYRLIDTAALYNNEASIGNAVTTCGLPRNQVFITTKLHPIRIWGAEKAFYRSLKKLRLDYVDLYLIHWPFLRTKALWKTLQLLQDRGHARAIGVSNFRATDIESLPGTIPAVNQVEFHPFLYRKALLEYSRSKGIVLEAHSPLVHGKRLNDPRILSIAKRYGKSSAQLLIRWSLQHQLVVIPKTLRHDQLRNNIDVFDFEIEGVDMAALDALSDNYHVAGLSRIVGDPA